MTPEQMKVTVDALRSDRYKQVTNWIGEYLTNHLCCIGVAAKVNGSSFFNGTDQASDFLKMTENQKTIMVEWNDTEKLSFSEIADRMETHRLFLGGV